VFYQKSREKNSGKKMAKKYNNSEITEFCFPGFLTTFQGIIGQIISNGQELYWALPENTSIEKNVPFLLCILLNDEIPVNEEEYPLFGLGR
jgi:hypothetical protein